MRRPYSFRLIDNHFACTLTTKARSIAHLWKPKWHLTTNPTTNLWFTSILIVFMMHGPPLLRKFLLASIVYVYLSNKLNSKIYIQNVAFLETLVTLINRRLSHDEIILHTHRRPPIPTLWIIPSYGPEECHTLQAVESGELARACKTLRKQEQPRVHVSWIEFTQGCYQISQGQGKIKT